MAGSEQSPIRVAVVHGEELVRQGACMILADKPDLELVYQGARLEDLAVDVQLGQVAEPHVVVMQLTPPMDGVWTAMRRWRRAYAHAYVVVIGVLTPALVQRAVEEGARGALTCGVACDEVLRCLRTVAGGGLHCNSWMEGQLQRGS